MDDLISRQAAIDALGEKPLAWIETEYETGLQNQWESDVEAIKAVPSAQPEIIRCKDCKRYLSPHGCCHIDGMVTSQEDGFCSYAERREE